MADDDFITIEVPPLAGTAYKMVDGQFVEMTDEERIADYVEAKAAHKVKVAEKGHDCWEHVVHYTFESSRGGQQDAYDCGICGDLLQVG